MEDSSPPRRRLSSRPLPPLRDPTSPRGSRERPSSASTLTQPTPTYRPLRVQIPSNAPPVRRSASFVTSPSISSAPSPSTSSGRSPALPPALTPRTPRTPPSSSSSFSHSQTQSLSSAAHHFPDLPSLITTSPPHATTSPRQFAARPRRTSFITGSSEAGSSPGVGSHSSKRKPPPPLALRRGPTWEGKGMARGDSSDSSEVEEADLWRAKGEGNVGVLTPVSSKRAPPSPASSPGKGSRDEERDTLSGLYGFPSPLLDAIASPTPSTFPSLAMHAPGPEGEVDGDDEAGDEGPDEDDTAGTGVSFLSSSSSSGAVSGSFLNGSWNTDGSTSTGFGAGRQYAGLGLGLPFSVSAAANLSSLATSLSPTPSAHGFSSVQPFPRSPSGERSGPESPVTDRSKLIGLGELATPRWTSGVLERKWGGIGEEKGEKRRAEDDVDEFDVLGSYGAESNSRPTTASGESPISSRPSSTRPPNGRQGSSHSSSSYPSSAVHPATLFPVTTASTLSSTIAPIAAGTIDFSALTPHFSPISPLDTSQPSPVYSLDAVSINGNELEDLTDQAQETLRNSQVAPPRFEPRSNRRSLGAAVSAPATAVGSSWTGPRDEEVSFAGAAEANAALAAATAALSPPSRRASVGVASPTATKRSSIGRTLSVDGKAPKSTHLRRQSASKSGFAHLPPSPIAPKTSFQSLAGAPLVPFQLPRLPSSPHPPNPSPARPASTSSPATISSTARTPDHVRASRHSFHSHQSSPSIVAASILRQTRDLEMEFEGVVDMDTLAAADTGTAEALRKLDGLSSPRLSKVYTGSPAGARSRTTSRDLGTPPTKGSRDSEDGKARRRTRSSTGGSVVLSKEAESALQGDGSRSSLLSATTMPLPSSAPGSPPPLPFPSASGTPSSGTTTVPMPRSPLSPPVQQLSRTPSSQVSPSYEVPFPTSSPFKRGSSSSASITAGTSTSATSRDSTSGTSLSGSSLATTAARSASSKNRRESAGSDVSSTPSLGESPAARSDRADSRGEVEVDQFIPPVPPLPKDWESYRPSTAGTSSSSAQNSPHFNADRRPSESSSFADSTLLSPRAADMETSWSVGSVGSSQGKTPTRKWSISFGKSKSPKPPSIKESSSHSDLPGSNVRNRNSSFSSHKSDPMGSRRMAASANDIAGLASGAVSRASQESSSASTSSKIRSSFKSDKTASASSRPRTSSVSSNGTTTTSNTRLNTNPPPSVVTTSPGRSRSSLLSPRRTPSGIPFFSRKSSGGSVTATPSPRQDKVDSPAERSSGSGRKSILGLNFLRGTKKEKEKAPLPPPQPFLVRKTQSMVPPPKEVDTSIVDEFGRRASIVAKTSSLVTRKRGKTLPGSMDEPIADVRPLGLPPMQMAALSATTVRRVDSLSSSASFSALSSQNGTPVNRPPPSLGVSGRAARLQESIKAHLPTIAGSPSSHTFPLVQDRQLSESTRTISPPKSLTPTKIPRLYQRAAATSPRLTPRASDSSLNRTTSPSTSGAANHRFSQYGADTSATRLSSSASSSQLAPSENDSFSSDFALSREPGLVIGEKTLSTRRRLDSEPSQSQIPRSRSSSTNTTNSLASSSRAQREALDSSTPVLSSRAGTALPRIPRRQSLLASDNSKAAIASAIAPRAAPVAATPRKVLTGARPMPAPASEPPTFASARRPISKALETPSSSWRTSAVSTADSLASSRSSRSIASKVPSRISKSSTISSLNPAPSTDTGRSSTNSNYGVSEEELRGDEEMSAYVRRQQAKKLASGASADVVRKMFEFPDATKPLPPLESRDALSLYSRYLSDYEKDEIREHDKVYFVGLDSEKKSANKDHPTNNFGFDDERGDYLLVPHDHILYRYEAIDVLGKGSFGQVLQCRDHKTGDMVAIKIIRNKKRFHHQALVEIKVLENLVNWDPDEKHFVIRMVDSFTFRGHLCIVTELLSINLYELVKANSFAGFTTTLIRRFTIQILGSLSLLRHHRVVHCDLKPENILLKHPAKSAIKVIDFGSSCFENEKVYTYIQSRFYRSPEVILGMNYHMAIDMWSLGCIIAEMYTGYPIFPGENEQEQLACIMEVMGLPDKYLVDRSSRKRLFFDSAGAPRPVVNSKGRRRRPGSKTLAQVLKSDDESFVDFISKCLTWDPDRRLKPDPALRHPWIVAARQRAISPSTIPARIGRSSLGTSTISSGSSISSASQISTPRRKVGTSTANSTPHSHHSSSNVPSTAPVERTRTSGSAAPGPPPRLTSKGSLGLPTSSSRYFMKSD